MVKVPDSDEWLSPRTEAWLRRRMIEARIEAGEHEGQRRTELLGLADCCRSLVELLAPPVMRRHDP